MDLDRLKFFVQVSELGSFSKVASLTGIDQSCISRRITSLEQDCSGRLFHRTGRGVTLTEFGAQVFPRVKSLLQEAEQLSCDLKTGAGVASGTVRIGVMPSLAHPAIAILLRQVRARFPAVHLAVIEGSSGRLDEWLASGRVDLAIMFRYGTTAPAGEEAIAVVDAFLVSAPGDAMTRNPEIDFAQLDGLPLTLPSVPNDMRVALDRIAHQLQIKLSVIMDADSLPIQRNIALSGDAYTVLSCPSVREELAAGRLQASRIVNPHIRRTIVLSTASAHPSTLASREVSALTRRIYDRLATDGTLGLEPPLATTAGQAAGSRRDAKALSLLAS